MLRRVKKYIKDNNMLADNAKVLVCVSGGADSVALLDILARCGYECIVAHCNFHLRGEESNRDEMFVRKIVPIISDKLVTKRNSIPIHVKDFDTLLYAQEHGVSIEMAARDLRYGWFMELSNQYGCQAIAVAHHQNDQAETILLNLKRGTGIRGLQGMRPVSTMAVNGKDYTIIRPFLCTTHDYICHYLRDIRHLDWVEDSTNKDITIKRNAIRKELEVYTKSEIEHMAETANRIQGYVDWLDGKETNAAKEIQEYEALRNNR